MITKLINKLTGFNYKQVILIREDLKLPKGKLAVQAAHASVEATLKSDSSMIKRWRSEGMKKAVLKVKSQKELYKYNQIAKDNGLTTAVISDAGLTTVKPGTVTCCAIGPAKEEDIDAVTGELKLMN